MNSLSMAKWLTWDGRYSFRGSCNRLERGRDRVVSPGVGICAEAGRSIPVVVPNIDVRVLASEVRDNRVWIRFRLQQPTRVRSLLLRIYSEPDRPGPANLVYQEVIDGETLSGLGDEPVPDEIGAPLQILGDLDQKPISFCVRLWVTTRAGDFETMREGNRYEPELRWPYCFPDGYRPKPQPPAEHPVETPSEPAHVSHETPAGEDMPWRGIHKASEGSWQAWQAPDPVLANMARRSDDDGSVIQRSAIPRELRWQAWRAPDPVAAAVTRVEALQPAAPQPAAPQPAPVQPPEPLFVWPDPPSENTHGAGPHVLPGAFRIQLARETREHRPHCQSLPDLLLAVCPAGDTPPRAVPEPVFPPVTARGVRGVITVDGVHFTELYNYDHPDNLYKAAAFLMKHHFGDAPSPSGMRRKVTALLRVLFTKASSSPLEIRLGAVIPPSIAAPDLESDTRQERYLTCIGDESYRGDPLHLAALGVVLGVSLRAYRPNGDEEPVPLLDLEDCYHRFHVAMRVHQNPNPLPRYHPLTEHLPDLTGTTPLPYQPDAAELESLYRDATLSHHYAAGTGNTLIRRVKSFYRKHDFRLITGDQL